MTKPKKEERALHETPMTYHPTMPPIARLREKNQLTIPHEIAEKVEAKPGDRFSVEIDPDDAQVIHLHRLPRSYAGIAAGLWPEGVLKYLEELRKDWDGWGE